MKVFVVFNKKELPAGARFVSVFLVVFRLVCVHRLRHIPSSIANRNSEKNAIFFSFWPRLFWKCVLFVPLDLDLLLQLLLLLLHVLLLLFLLEEHIVTLWRRSLLGSGAIG